MPAFTYKAIDSSGNLHEGVFEAKEEKLVVQNLHLKGYIPIKVESKVEKGSLSREISWQNLFERISNRDILFFTQQLFTLLEAGIPLDKSLEISSQLCEKNKMKRIITQILQSVREGNSLADSLEKFPNIFPKIYINVVRAGEVSGVLETVLMRLYQFLEESQDLKDNIISASIYPIILTIAGSAMVLILLVFVIPQFAVLFSDMGRSLPLPTQILIDLSNALKKNWWFVFIFIVSGFFFKRYINTKSGRLTWDGFKLKVPLVNRMIQKIEVANFSRTLGTLMNSGVPILKAITIVKETIGNQVMAGSIEKVFLGVRKGSGISKPIEDSKIFPPLATHLIKVGEETGNLENMLIKVAAIYDKEVKSSFKKLVSLLEPVLILFMGLIVGFIVLSMLLAIMSVNEVSF
jgi:general secretion pathway protein F